MRGAKGAARPGGVRAAAVTALGVLCAGLVSCQADRDGSLPEPATRPLAAAAVAIGGADTAPDTSFVVFTGLGPQGRDLVRLETASGATRPITPSPEAESSPRISPDGSRVAFLRDGASGSELWIAAAGGGEAARVAAGDGDLSGPAWSPGGDRLLVAREGSLFLAEAAPAASLEPAGWAVPPGAAEPDWGPDGMVVFGLGRSGATPLMKGPNRFYIGFHPLDIHNQNSFDRFRKHVESIRDQYVHW